MADTFQELETKIAALNSELSRLRAATDLRAVQEKLDSFMEEIRMLHRGFLAILQDMISSLNAEGVKRYEGAVKSVRENTKIEIDRLEKLIKELCAK